LLTELKTEFSVETEIIVRATMVSAHKP